MTRLRPVPLALISALALLAAAPARAQIESSAEIAAGAGEDAAPGDTIVVTGQTERASARQVHRQARSITASDRVLDIPLARFERSLCVGVAGMREDYAALMIDRVRETAAELDIRVQGDGCSPNFIIAFVRDSRQTLADIVAANPEDFQFLDTNERREMLAEAPVHVWLNIEPHTRDGVPIPQQVDLVNTPVSRDAMAHSRIYTTIRRDIMNAMVIFDLDAISGLSVRQLADYATMRALAQTRPADDLALTSILGLYAPDGAQAAGLTDFDRAYLLSLYDWIPNLPAATKIGGVPRFLRRLAEDREAQFEDGEGGGEAQ